MTTTFDVNSFNPNDPESLKAARQLLASTGGPATSTQAPPVQPTVPEPSDDVADDEEIIEFAHNLVLAGKSQSEIKAVLIEKFEDVEADADDLIFRAQDREIEEAQKHENEMKAILGKVVDERNAVEAERDKLLVETYEKGGRLGEGIDPKDIEHTAKLIRLREEEENREETFDDKDEVFPECPIFPGALTELARALYPSLPLEFKQCGLITRWGLLRSGLDHLENEPHLQPRFYMILVSKPNRGKTASINESRHAMDSILKIAADEQGKQNNSKPTPRAYANVENLASADSGPFLAQHFYDLAKTSWEDYTKSVCSDNSAKILLDPDELSDVFEKARITNGRTSTLFMELLKLHSNNRTGNGTKQRGDRSVDNAHLAILAGTTVRKYPSLWTGTGGGSDGLNSRFLIVTSNAEQVPPVPLPSDHEKVERLYQHLAQLAQLPGQIVRLSPEAREKLTDWWASIDNSKDNATRVLEAVKQLLVVLAVTNLPDNWTGTVVVVGPELVQSAIEFANFELLVREQLNPADSWTHVQAMENLIIAWAKKHTSRYLGKTKNDCRRGIQPQRHPGGLGTFTLAWRNCVESGVLKLREQSHKGARYSL